jgi:ABC-2 type transport system ATP-binding protein
VLRDLDEADIAIDDIGLRRPTLDDVFLTLTGHAAEEAQSDADDLAAAAADKKSRRSA